MTYWVVLKSGELRVQSKVPKSRPYVAETSSEVKGDFQHYQHVFQAYNKDGVDCGRRLLDSYCGFDRGPKREGIVREMLAKAS